MPLNGKASPVDWSPALPASISGHHGAATLQDLIGLLSKATSNEHFDVEKRVISNEDGVDEEYTIIRLNVPIRTGRSDKEADTDLEPESTEDDEDDDADATGSLDLNLVRKLLAAAEAAADVRKEQPRRPTPSPNSRAPVASERARTTESPTTPPEKRRPR